SLNRFVALKVITAGAEDRVSNADWFRIEAEAVATLDHPHIVPLLEAGALGPLLYYTMKLIDGEDLQSCLARFQDQPKAIARLTAQVAEAIHHAHQRGVLHHDLKPSNILVDQRGAPHVIDFGLAHRLGAGTDLAATQPKGGTPSYMAPEQIAGRATIASDVYSLGAILYELLTGSPPFRGRSPKETLHAVSQLRASPPSEQNPRVDRDLETICLKCLEKDPEARYASARDLAEELNRWLRGESILTRPASPARRLVKWARRRPAIAAMIVVVGLVSTLGLGGITWGWYQAVIARAGLRAALIMTQQSRDEALRSEDLARHLAYAAKLSLAQRHWQDANLAQLLRQLDQTRPTEGKPDLRGFEWYYLNRLSRVQGQTLAGHTDFVRSMAYSPDGRRLASAGNDQTIKLWDPATGQVIRSLTAGTYIRVVAFHPDGTRLASTGADRAVTLWDAATGQPIRTLAGHAQLIYELAFSPDGKTLASLSMDGTIKLWDLAADAPVRTLQDHRVDSVGGLAFSPDGKTLASAGGGEPTIRLWDVATGQLARSLREDGPAGPDGKTLLTMRQLSAQRHWKPIAFRPDGKILATGAGDGTVQLWDPAAGTLVRTLIDHRDLCLVTTLAFSPDGKTLASTRRTGQKVDLWDPTTGHLRNTLRGHAGSVLSASFSPDGVHLATACSDMTIRIWDTTRDLEARSLAESDEVMDVAFGPDGSYLAAASRDRTITLRELATGQVVRVLRGPSDLIQCVAISRDGRRVVSGGDDRTIRVWEVATGKELRVLQGHAGSVVDLAFSPDGTTLASASEDRTVRLWDAETFRPIRTFQGHILGVTAIAFSPDGKTLASGGKDGFVLFWEFDSGRQLRVLKAHPEANGVRSLALSPDGRWLAAGGFDPSILIWEVATGQEVQTLTGHAITITGLAFSPDGRRLASASADRTVRIWDPAFGQEVLSLRGHDGPVWAVAFSPDGTRLATASEDQTLRLWEAHTDAGPRPNP
ncbi:MAG TPA: protein kinase, partial [Isosphaeraceae bacterium]|nr:protein kinase [Isosphaeraceae bacterium]